jgi:hypothetical protein
MLNLVRLFHETVIHVRFVFTSGELSMILDIYKDAYPDAASIGSGAGLVQSVEDSFSVYPGTYEAKWGVEKDPMLKKIGALDEWQAACLAIWASDFWESHIYTQPNGLKEYVTGKTDISGRIKSALTDLQSAVDLQEKTKGAFKSALVAEARTKTEAAFAIFKTLFA